jgi:GT2 family glycosyltransferase
MLTKILRGNMILKITRVFRKILTVLKRDGIKNGIIRGFEVLKEYKLGIKTSKITTALLDIRGLRYIKDGRFYNVTLSDIPKVSIIIPVYNGLDFITNCIQSLLKNTSGINYEVIVIDQNSKDGSQHYLKRLSKTNKNFILIKNKENIGFAAAMNQGVAIAKGEFIVLANSDLIFTPGWLPPLVKLTQDNPEIAIVSPMTNYVGEGLQVDIDAKDIAPDKCDTYAHSIIKRSGTIEVIDRLVFFCVLIRKNVYELLGGLSSVYGLGNYEDDDFSLRVRLLGYKLMIVKKSFVYHYGSKTFKQQKINYTNNMIRNEKIFFQRVVDFSLSTNFRSPLRDKEIKISVILRTKNRPYLLQHALTSLANQTFKNFEVLIINDGEINIHDIGNRFMDYFNLYYIEDEKGKGRSAALNRGLSNSHGDWITYLDDDDLYYPLHLEKLYNAATQYPDSALIYTDTNKSLSWMENGQRNMTTLSRERFLQQSFDYKKLLYDNWIPIMSLIHPRYLAISLNGFDENYHVFEDWEFLLRLTKGRIVQRISGISCEYRMRFGSEPNDSTLADREKALQYRKLIYKQYPVEDKLTNQIRESTLDYAKYQIEYIQDIQKQNLSTIQKNYLITSKLGTFKTVNDRFRINIV